ncbi:MAG: hypothetical protein JWO15_3754 [Sphingomonadales bacterium]|nr:hypothetical protein [Sphingomonadales bacterium]
MSGPVEPDVGAARPPRKGKTGKGRGGDRTTDEARLEEAARTRQVLLLRRSGLSFAQIAEATDYADASGAAHAWRRAVKNAVQIPARETIALELERLDVAQAAIWTKVMNGNISAIEAWLKISAHRAKLEGMYKPVKLTLSGEEETEVHDAVADLLAILQGNGAPS